MSIPTYATREDVKGALDFKQTARADQQIDRALRTASRGVDALCHRRFYPELATRSWDWPNGQGARPWRLWLDANELISITEVTTGGDIVPPEAVLPEPNQYGPPYNQVQLNISSPTSGWEIGDTHQRSIAITGLYGYHDDETLTGQATGALDTTATTVTVDADTSAAVGVGNLLRLDTERIIITGRTQTDTGQTLNAGIDAQAKTVMVPVGDTTGFAVGETLLIDGERLHIVDIAGAYLVVKRAWDGTVLTAHTTGAVIYAPRTLTVARGALGTTAAAHADGVTVHRFDPPPLAHQLALGEAINIVLQEQAGWFRTAGSGSSGKEASLAALTALRTQTYDALGRKARLRGV